MHFKCIKFSLIVLLNFINLNRAENCHDEPVILDNDFADCCRGIPKYTSESCIDALLENNTLSHECIVNCIYRQFEIYDGETINMASVKTFVDSEIPQEDFALMYMNAFEKCSKLDKIIISEKFNFLRFDNLYGCDEYPTLVDMCVWYHNLANCPTSFATDNENCNNKRQWVNECLFES